MTDDNGRGRMAGELRRVADDLESGFVVSYALVTQTRDNTFQTIWSVTDLMTALGATQFMARRIEDMLLKPPPAATSDEEDGA